MKTQGTKGICHGGEDPFFGPWLPDINIEQGLIDDIKEQTFLLWTDMKVSGEGF